jgi:hypothetical protein
MEESFSFLSEEMYFLIDKLPARFDKTIEETRKFKNQIKSNKLACTNRAKFIAENVTIREEYINCGKTILLQRRNT